MNLLEKFTNALQETLEQGASLALHNKNQEIASFLSCTDSRI